MSAEDTRIAALRRYHAERMTRTRSKLAEALDRIEAGNTAVLNASAKLTKTNLCLEAGVSIHTLLTREPESGVLRYADIIERLEQLRRRRRTPKDSDDDRDAKIAELKEAYKVIVEEKLEMALEIDSLGMALLREREEVARLCSIEVQNAELREEIRRMQSAKLQLVGK